MNNEEKAGPSDTIPLDKSVTTVADVNRNGSDEGMDEVLQSNTPSAEATNNEQENGDETNTNEQKVETKDQKLDTKEQQQSGKNNAGRNFGDVQEKPLGNGRSCTDLVFLAIFIVFLLALVGLLSYCAWHGDVRRIIYGYDDCGNICGLDNGQESENSLCRVRDMTGKSRIAANRCIRKKSGDTRNNFISKTGIKNFFEEVAEDLNSSWLELLYLSLIALVASAAILVLFRYAARFIIWTVLIGIVIACVSATIYLWILWVQAGKNVDDIEQRRETMFLVFAIFATIITVIVLLVILVMRKRIKLVVRLFTEAGKAVAAMPLLLCEPILTFISLGVVVALGIYFSLVIQSAGTLTQNGNSSVYFRKDAVIQVTRWYNLMAIFWFSQFVIACQHIAIAGAVATWFFTRDKRHLSAPIATGYKNLLRYHLGTAAAGSLLLALIWFLRVLYNIIKYTVMKTEYGRTAFNAIECCCCCCCRMVQSFLKFWTKNAYIQTAISGLSFCKAGERAFGLLAQNALRVMAINSVGDFVLLLGKLLVVVITVVVGVELFKNKEDIHHSWVPILLAGLIAFMLVHCCLSVYEMAIDTIFQCFCVDCDENDGITRPYFMSRGLMEFVTGGKQALQQGPPSPRPQRSAWEKQEPHSGKRVSTVSETVR